jgi:NADPH:quinone reductase
MPLPEQMTAIVITAPGDPNVLKPMQRPLPPVGPNDVLIKVEAAGLNRADLMQREGRYRLPPMPEHVRDIPGLEAAGTIAAIGSDVEGWAIGDRVAAILVGGGYAEYVAVDAGQVLPVPAGLSMVEAASLPEAALTVWGNVFERGRLEADEFLLVHGGTSGIGSFAIQLAAARGARVIATAGSPEKCRACLGFGAFAAINYRDGDFSDAVRQLTDGHGADVILDMVGGDYVDRNIAIAAEEGRIVNVAFIKGSKVTVDLGLAMSKRLTLTGSTLRNRPVAYKTALTAAVRAEVWPLIEAGKVKPVIDSEYPLAEAWRGHERVYAEGHIGKVMLRV